MKLSSYIEEAGRRKFLPAGIPEREPGCDDDRRPDETWERFCMRLAWEAVEKTIKEAKEVE